MAEPEVATPHAAAATSAPASTPRAVRRVGPFSFRQLGVVGLVVAMAAGGLVVLTAPLGRPPTPSPIADPNTSFYRMGNATTGLAIGDRAPELAVPGPNGATTPLLDLDGAPIRLADLRGHPVWINFFASWCPPCQAETPTIRDVAADYRSRGLVVIGVAVADASTDDVRAYAQRYGLSYTIGFDATQGVYTAWRNVGIPTQYLIDADGIIRLVVKGPLVDRATAEAALATIVPTETPRPSVASPAASGYGNP
jgi:peroxiredoxin